MEELDSAKMGSKTSWRALFALIDPVSTEFNPGIVGAESIPCGLLHPVSLDIDRGRRSTKSSSSTAPLRPTPRKSKPTTSGLGFVVVLVGSVSASKDRRGSLSWWFPGIWFLRF